MQMTEEIIGLLPSKALKAKIRQVNHTFRPGELLQIIRDYAPTHDKRLLMLQRFADETEDPEFAALAKTIAAAEKANFEYLQKSEDGTVYELRIKTEPQAFEERYLCATYQAALICIDRFFAEYRNITTETEKTRYTIQKRKIFTAEDSFDEDFLASCEMGPGKVVLAVFGGKNTEDCSPEDSCDVCARICPHRFFPVEYPNFVKNHGLIRYTDEKGENCYGVVLLLDGENAVLPEYYVIPLHSATVREHLFDAEFYDHVHIELPLAAPAFEAELDKRDRANYGAFRSYLKR